MANDDELYEALIEAGKRKDLSQRGFVERCLSHSTGFVRAAAVRVVTSYWRLAEHERTALGALHDADADVREAAAHGLSHYAHGPNGPLREVLAVALDEREADVVRDAAYHATLVLAGVDRARYPWGVTVPRFEEKADWSLVAELVARCGGEVPETLSRRAKAASLDPERRSAMQVLLDGHAAVLDALEPLQREPAASPPPLPPRSLPCWRVVRERRRNAAPGAADDGVRDVLAEVDGPLTLLAALAPSAAAAVEAIVARARARGPGHEVRFEREELLDLRDVLGAALGVDAPLAALVTRAIDAHAELCWTDRASSARSRSDVPPPPRASVGARVSASPHDSFAAHVLASGGVVFGVMADGASSSTDLMTCVAGELAEYGYVLADSGEIVDARGVGTGWAWWSEPAAAYADRPWHVERSPCPFLGACLGYIGVKPWYGAPDDEDGLWGALARTARGVIARLDDDRALTTIALQRRTLDDAVARNGLDDGDALIEREPGPYFDDVVARIHAVAKSAGVGVHTLATSHNPIRRVEWHEHGERILDTSAEQRRRASIEVELWLRVCDVTEPPCFGALASQRR